MKFVRSLTSIPVPRVYAVIRLPPWIFRWRRKQTVRYPDSAFIFMDRIDGESLDIHTWLSLDYPARDRIVAQLHGYVSQLRSLTSPPGTVIGSAFGKPVSDDRLAQGWPTDEEFEISGPYADEGEMNLALRRQNDLSEFPPTVVESHSRSHPLAFTHGDFDLRNVMVKGNKVVALIDWEASGWFPAHWEYLKAHWVPSVHEREREWRARIKEIVTPYEMERAADKEVIEHVIQELR
jgi:aminoglycoside phosphotransferase (APT) family kinase protein